MKKLAERLLNRTKELNGKILSGNAVKNGWSKVISATHAFNSSTGNDIVFVNDKFKFYTDMSLNKG